MTDLTDAQKEECQKILNDLMAWCWHRLRLKMVIDGMDHDDALAELLEDIRNER